MNKLAFLLAAAAWIGCGGGDDDGATGGPDASAAVADATPQSTADAAPSSPDAAPLAACERDGDVCARIRVPAGFTGTPRQLLVGLYDSLPPLGPPASLLAQVDDPEIGPDEPFVLEVDSFPDTGQLYVYVALYMEGGGTFVPVAGVDYVGQSDAPFAFDGSAVDLGDLTLALAE